MQLKHNTSNFEINLNAYVFRFDSIINVKNIIYINICRKKYRSSNIEFHLDDYILLCLHY